MLTMTTGNEIATRTPQQELVARVRDPLTIEQLQMALPPSVTVDRFVRVMTSAILANPDLAKLDHTSVLRALVQSAAMGLIPDGKQAAITPRKGQAVLVPMIQGFRDIAAEHGWTLRTAVVYANEEFEHAVIDGEESIIHRPVRPGMERGELIAAYAIAKHRDGRKLMTVLHPEDIAHRRKSSAYDAVWNEHPAAMWEKSAGRDLFAQLGLAESDSEATRIRRILEESDLGPGDAARALYGPTDSPVDTKALTTGPASPTEHTGEVPQADGAAQEPQTPPASASPVPGQDADDEPDIGGGGVATAESAPSDADIQLAAQQAAMFRVPKGKYRDVSLGELMRQDGGEGWLRNRLNVVTEPQEYVTALWSFARVYAPALFTEALAKKEASA